MKVVMLCQYPWDWQRMSGGVESAAMYLGDELAKVQGVDLRIVSCRTEAVAPQTRPRGRIQVTYLPRLRFGRITFHAREIRAMQRLIERESPDIVHAHGSGLYAGAALASRRPSVITVHGIVFREARLARGWGAALRGELDTAYERRCLRRAKHLIALSPYVARELAGLTQARTFFVPNAVCDAFFRLDRRPEPGRILFTGVVSPRKGVAELVRAVAQVRARIDGVTLRVAGHTGLYPEYHASIQSLVRDLGLQDSVTFLGFLSEPRVLNEYVRASVLALSSCQETLPVAVQQAMGARLPVVSTRVGGVPDIIQDGRSGLLVEAGDIGGLARALEAVLTDPPLAAALANAARDYAVKHFSAPSVARRTVEVYRQVVADSGVRT